MLLKTDDGQVIHPFEYAEHAYLGDTLTLKWHDGAEYLGAKKTFNLPNGETLTYGQFNAMSGDYFGSNTPICQGSDLKAQQDLLVLFVILRARLTSTYSFRAGFKTLAIDADGAKEISLVKKLKLKEVELVNQAAREGKNPSEVYLNDVPSTRDNIISGLLGMVMKPGTGYLGLALINFDHFGQGARTAYNAGHLVAMQKAAEGRTPGNLEAAYMMNAFADHFLEDSFAAGHIRTPRQALHGTVNLFADVCAQYMHEEDNALGLTVSNPNGQTWISYGDSKLLDQADTDNLARCHDALMASTDEIYKAWDDSKVPFTDPSQFGAWKFAPIISSAFSEKNHAPLFNEKGYPRVNIDDRWKREYEGWWGFTYPTTWNSLKSSDKFKAPIKP